MSEIWKARGIFQKEPGGPHYIRYKDGGGVYRREKTGAFGTAQKLLAKRVNEALQGKKLPETLRRRFVPFSEIAEDCLVYSDGHKRSKRVDHSRMNKLLEWFGSMPADAITAEEIERRFDGEKWSKATRNRYKAVLSLCFKLAIRAKKASSNPARDVAHQKESDGRTRFLAVAEEKRLRPVILEKFPERLPEFELALHTGMRHEEQYGLKWSDVHLEHRFATVIVHKGGSRATYVRLNDQAIRALLALRERTLGTGYVCGDTEGATDWFEDCLKAAEIAGFTWHCLRHTFASRLAMSGADPRAVAELLRDKTLHMAMRYSHLAPDFTQVAVERMGEKFHSTTVAPEPLQGRVRVN